MHTLSVRQATREKFHIIAYWRASAASLARRTAATDRAALVLLVEILLAALSYALAVVLLSQARKTAWIIEVLRATLGWLILFRLAGSAIMRLYQRSLRYASTLDLVSIAQAIILSSILLGLVVSWKFPRLNIPIAVFVVDAAFLQLLWGALHFGARITRAQQASSRKNGKRAIIVGAGDAGITVLREIALDATSPCRPVALVDDDAQKCGRTLYGVPVLAGTKDLARISVECHADEILICIPSATRAQMHDILEASRHSNIPVRSLPSLSELIHGAGAGKVSRHDLHSPRIENLLQREEICLDAEEARQIVGGKTVLVTGAGGSIGSELSRQIIAASPRKLLLLDKSENSLFYVNRETSEHLGAARVKPYLEDLLDKDRIDQILRNEQPEIIFHAAAHKHVGMLELHPQEAIRNNVLGTRNIAAAAQECGAARFVNISTDKAVDPRNYMGLSKKLTEMCIQEMACATARHGGTRFSNVRFGNVAGSTGSVLRLFWDQIQKGGPVRVTDPRATRYFMSISEAVHLILRAAALGKGGETFVFDMGKPLNIYELAKTMMLFAGLKPEVDVPIEFIGLQPGEKISEELWGKWEHPVPTSSGRVLVIHEKDARVRGILASVSEMEELLTRADSDGLLQYIQEIFPDFRGSRTDAVRQPKLATTKEPVAIVSLGAA